MSYEADNLIKEGYAARRRGDHAEALAKYKEGATTYLIGGNRIKLASAIRHIADIHQDLGELDTASPYYDEALSLYHSMPNPPAIDLANCFRPMALLAEAQGRTADAIALWTQARAKYVEAADIYRDLPLQPAYDECDKHLAALKA